MVAAYRWHIIHHWCILLFAAISIGVAGLLRSIMV